MSRNRLLLSSIVALVIALSLATLAAANTVDVNGSALHVGTRSPNYVVTYPAHLSVGDVASAPAISNVRVEDAPFGGMHGTIRFRAKNWNGGSQKTPMSTPEPGSLMLLSTGLVGIAGMVRRKLLSPMTIAA
jgi:PEP-CTERM motif